MFEFLTYACIGFVIGTILKVIFEQSAKNDREKQQNQDKDYANFLKFKEQQKETVESETPKPF